ncbi:hypothetical protein P280DRAFT_482769 [Massarina eburnea CBS 473.64]|uniref:F-box domain-containing protein n=1 Tax=Massarina eburnea CBS 473.64 TaxID=1395130 RepID=A0A6A6RRY1_9PLEO|nr:hypothetical protein P280DRAFT_482769 [Massarina eburnea CBS 473.64]
MEAHDHVPFLPNELIARIFSFLDGESIESVLLTCKAFSHLAFPLRYCSVKLLFSKTVGDSDALINTGKRDNATLSVSSYAHYLELEKTTKWKRVYSLSIVIYDIGSGDNEPDVYAAGTDVINSILGSVYDLKSLTLDTSYHRYMREQHIPFLDTFQDIWPKARLHLRPDRDPLWFQCKPYACVDHSADLMNLRDTCPSLTRLSLPCWIHKLSLTPPLTHFHIDESFMFEWENEWEESALRWMEESDWSLLESFTAQTLGNGEAMAGFLGRFKGRTPLLQEFSFHVTNDQGGAVYSEKTTTILNDFLGEVPGINKISLAGFDMETFRHSLMSVAASLQTLRFSGAIDADASRDIFTACTNLKHLVISADVWHSLVDSASISEDIERICQMWLDTHASFLPPSLEHLELWVAYPPARWPVSSERYWDLAVLHAFMKNYGRNLKILDLHCVQHDADVLTPELGGMDIACSTLRAQVVGPIMPHDFQGLEDDSKRRCDRQFPECQRCLDRDVDCVYPQRKKQRRGNNVRTEESGVFDEQIGVTIDDIENDFIFGDLDASQNSGFDPLLLDGLVPYMPTLPLPESIIGNPSAQGETFENHELTHAPNLWFLQDETWDLQHVNERTGCITEMDHESFIRDVDEMLKCWVQTGHNSFIHPRLYEKGMPTCLQDAFTTLAAYTARTPAVKETILQIAEERSLALARQPTPSGTDARAIMEHLARVQALFVYAFIRLFDGSVRLRASAERQIGALRLWSFQMWDVTKQFQAPPALFETLPNQTLASEFDTSTSLWRLWILTESVRRTHILVNSTANIYETMVKGWVQCTGAGMFTARKGLWEAQSAIKWIELSRQSSPLMVQALRPDLAIERCAAGEVDDFVKLLWTFMVGRDIIACWVDRGEKVGRL